MNTLAELCTEAWLLRGINSIPGALKLADGRLSYTAFGSGTLGRGALEKLEMETSQPGVANQLNSGEEVVLFDSLLNGVQKIEFPWYYFSGGVKLTVDGVGYRIGFDRPANTTVTDQVEESLENIVIGVEGLGEVANARRIGKAWKATLSAS